MSTVVRAVVLGATDAPEWPARGRAAECAVGNWLEPVVVEVTPPPEYVQVAIDIVQMQDAGCEELCVVCLTETVAIMLLPCRHAVLCRRCADTVRGAYRAGAYQGRCPICRSEVIKVVVGRFQEDFVRLLTEDELTNHWVQASSYVSKRLLLVVGVFGVFGAPSIFLNERVLVVRDPAALVASALLAAALLLIGYLPSVRTTLAAFGWQGAGSGRARTSLSSPSP